MHIDPTDLGCAREAAVASQKNTPHSHRSVERAYSVLVTFYPLYPMSVCWERGGGVDFPVLGRSRDNVSRVCAGDGIGVRIVQCFATYNCKWYTVATSNEKKYHPLITPNKNKTSIEPIIKQSYVKYQRQKREIQHALRHSHSHTHTRAVSWLKLVKRAKHACAQHLPCNLIKLYVYVYAYMNVPPKIAQHFQGDTRINMFVDGGGGGDVDGDDGGVGVVPGEPWFH